MGEVVAVLSGKGGTGKTSVCAGIATALAQSGETVLCIDCDVGLRNLDISLGMAECSALSFLDVCGDGYGLDWAEKHPSGPYVYSLWSSIPDDEGEYERWCRYLALYKPMVRENSLAYIELRDCDEILSDIPDKVIVSMFVNEETYLVVSNLSGKDYTLNLRESWENRVTKERKNSISLKPEEMVFLKKC